MTLSLIGDNGYQLVKDTVILGEMKKRKDPRYPEAMKEYVDRCLFQNISNIH